MFSISTQFSSIWPINITLSGATTPGQSGPGSDGNKGVLRIPQSYTITGALWSDFLVSYLGHSLGESYFSAETQSVYSTAPNDWATWRSLGKSYPSTEMQSVYSTAPNDWATWRPLEKSYTPTDMQSVYSTAPAVWATWHSLGESYSSAEMHSLYSVASADWAIGV